jgi:hypothetical protein
VVAGCGGPTFRNIGVGGNNIGVSVESIEDYAERNGMSAEQAVQAMRIEGEQNRIAGHADKYGISEKEAEAQLHFSDTQVK